MCDCAVAQIDDADLRQAAFAFGEDTEVSEEVSVVEHDVGTVGQHFTPVLAPGIGDRSADQAEVASGIVGADVERAAVVVGIIFDALLAGLDDLQSPSGWWRG